MILLLFPHQLLEKEVKEVIKTYGIKHVILWEDPAFFGDRRGSPHGPSVLRLNRMRILYMRVATKMYETWLKTRTDTKLKVERIDVDMLSALPLSKRYGQLKGQNIVAFDPVDHLLMSRMHRAGLSIQWLDSPCFLMTREELQKYRGTHAGRLQHSKFFEVVKEKTGLLKGVSSTDVSNRSPYPAKGGPNIPDPYVELQKRTALWTAEQAWLKSSMYAKNPGPVEDPNLPLTHDEVRAWLDKFLKQRFDLFGKYEDAVVRGQPWMFHSGLSIYLNMGLITPSQVIEKVQQLPKRQREKTENYEGFLRQLLGWREYARFYYEFVAPSTYLKNVFKLKGKLSPAWYERGTKSTGVPLIDETIADAWRYGYLHHIRRLMVVCNFMTLEGIDPSQVFAWMYEFSLDSYDWVMVFNVYSMGTWCDGGYAMRKPYISGAAYLQRMAQMRDPMSVQKWNEMFHVFLRKHADVLMRTQLAGIVRKVM